MDEGEYYEYEVSQAERLKRVGNEKAFANQVGLTKRELFAGLAMQGILAGLYGNKEMYLKLNDSCKEVSHSLDRLIATLSKVQADELLKQLGD